MSEVDQLGVWLGDARVGTLLRLPDDRVTFAFDPEHADRLSRPTLSLGFKGQRGGLITPEVTDGRLPPYFANLLPEGSLRRYIAAQLGDERICGFDLIVALGGDLPGNVRIIAEASTAPATDNKLRFSLSGTQLKFSVREDEHGGFSVPMNGIGGDWIVKLPSARFADVPVHEHAMLELARRIGLEVPPTRLVDIAAISGLPGDLQCAERQALALRRFDRADGKRIHTEDFAQVFSVYPERKYLKASSEHLGRVVLAECGVDEVIRLVRRLVFTVLIGNGDGHLKNWSLIYRDGKTAALAPLYDQVATSLFLPQDRLALAIGGSKLMQEVGLEQFATFADKVGVPVQRVEDTVRETAAAFRAALRDGVELPGDQAKRLEERAGKIALSPES